MSLTRRVSPRKWHVGDDDLVPVDLRRRRCERVEFFDLLVGLGHPKLHDHFACLVYLPPEQVAVVGTPPRRGEQQAPDFAGRCGAILIAVLLLQRGERESAERQSTRKHQEGAA
ncbi:hypothetical protein V5E97_09345 [Singulisphaera sp. Ch08]|uniref:Uncharacterized protein n=1 Tax=Singulisphaera sp. Ch08 TaxID=3120278 RepID=A0AAU7CLV1_9BACT